MRLHASASTRRWSTARNRRCRRPWTCSRSSRRRWPRRRAGARSAAPTQQHGVALRSLTPARRWPSCSTRLGQLVVKQQVVPLNTVARHRHVRRRAGRRGAPLRAQRDARRHAAARPPRCRPRFAPAQFFAMSDDEKLAAPSFESMDAGVVFGERTRPSIAAASHLRAARVRDVAITLRAGHHRAPVRHRAVHVDRRRSCSCLRRAGRPRGRRSAASGGLASAALGAAGGASHAPAQWVIAPNRRWRRRAGRSERAQLQRIPGDPEGSIAAARAAQRRACPTRRSRIVRLPSARANVSFFRGCGRVLRRRSPPSTRWTQQARSPSMSIARSRSTAAPLPPVTVRLRGPADVVGIDPHQIVRTDPRPNTTDFEPNYFPVDRIRPPGLSSGCSRLRKRRRRAAAAVALPGGRAQAGRRAAREHRRFAAAGPEHCLRPQSRSTSCPTSRTAGRGDTAGRGHRQRSPRSGQRRSNGPPQLRSRACCARGCCSRTPTTSRASCRRSSSVARLGWACRLPTPS